MVRPCLAGDPQSQLVVEVMQRPHCGHSVPPSVGQDTLRRWLQSLIQDTIGVDQRRSTYTAYTLSLGGANSSCQIWYIYCHSVPLRYKIQSLHFVTLCSQRRSRTACTFSLGGAESSSQIWYIYSHSVPPRYKIQNLHFLTRCHPV